MKLPFTATALLFAAGTAAAQEAEAAGSAPEFPAERRIRLYPSLKALEDYLRSIDALEKPLEELGRPI